MKIHVHGLLLISLVIAASGCKKNYPELPNFDDRIVPDELVHDITKVKFSTILVKECFYSLTLSHSYNGTLEYRFRPGQQQDSRYFYAIEKRFSSRMHWQYNEGESWNETGDWQTDHRLYRYDFARKKSWLYQSKNDQSPFLLFDFNLEVGDVIDLAHHIDDFDCHFEVLEVSEDTVNGFVLPNIHGKIIAPDALSNIELDIGPEQPNILMFEQKTFLSELNDLSSNAPECQIICLYHRFTLHTAEGNQGFSLH